MKIHGPGIRCHFWSPLKRVDGNALYSLAAFVPLVHTTDRGARLTSIRLVVHSTRLKHSIGRLVVFLASSEAEEITGQAINVDGGAMFN